jgi:predicted MFS family arabinose efflux permease
MSDAPPSIATPDPAGQPRMSPRRILATVWLAVFSTSLFFRAVDPIIPQIAADLNETIAATALLATAFALPYALMQPILGALADMLGKSRMMFACLVIVTFSTFAGAFSPNLPTLMVSRAISGIVAGGTFPIALALIAQVVPVEERQIAVSRVLAGAMLGNLMGSALSGIVADSFGWRGVFLVNGIFAMAALIGAFIGFGGPGRKPPERVDLRSLPAAYMAIFRHPAAKFCFGGVMMEGIFLTGFFPYVAPALHAGGETRGLIAGIVIGCFGLGGMLYSGVVGTVLPLVGQRIMMMLGGAGMGFGLMIMSAHLPWQWQAAVFAGFGLSFYFLHGAIQIFVTELVPSARSIATAIHSTFFFLGQSVGPIYYRIAFDEAGMAPTLIFSGCVLVLTGVVCSLGLTSQRPR